MGNLIDDYVRTHGSNLVQNPNVADKPKFNGDGKVDTKTLPDSISFLEMYSKLKTNEELSGEGICIDEGKINNQDACIKTVYSHRDKKLYKEGFIGGKKLELYTSNKVDKDMISVNYKGKYNNKDIDLTLSYPRESKLKEIYYKMIRNRLYIPDDINISGTIDNKPYEIKLPDCPVPRDSDEKDIVTVLLDSNSLCPAVINGNVVAIEPGQSIIHNWEGKIRKRTGFFNENIQPLVAQALSAALGAVLGTLGARFKAKMP